MGFLKVIFYNHTIIFSLVFMMFFNKLWGLSGLNIKVPNTVLIVGYCLNWIKFFDVCNSFKKKVRYYLRFTWIFYKILFSLTPVIADNIICNKEAFSLEVLNFWTPLYCISVPEIIHNAWLISLFYYMLVAKKQVAV